MLELNFKSASGKYDYYQILSTTLKYDLDSTL